MYFAACPQKVLTEKDCATEQHLTNCLFVCSATSGLRPSSIQAFLLSTTAVRKEVVFYIFRSPVVEAVSVVYQAFCILLFLRTGVMVFLMLTCC